MSLAHEVSFAIDERIFNEGGKADRFWIIHTRTVALDVHVPGRRAAVVETLGARSTAGLVLAGPAPSLAPGGPGRQPGTCLRVRRGRGP